MAFVTIQNEILNITFKFFIFLTAVTKKAKRVNAQVHVNSVAKKMQNDVDAKNKGGKKVCEFVFIMRSLTMFTRKNFKLFRLTTS